MKEKIKEFLLHFLIIYVVFIVVGSLIQLINYPTDFKLSHLDTTKNNETYAELKKEADLILEDNNCHNAIREVVNYYEKTNFDGKININKYFYDDDFVAPLYFASILREKCSQYESKLEEENIYGKLLAGSLFYEEIFNKKFFAYEINFKDIYLRAVSESVLDVPEYNAERRLELEIIRELLEMVKEDKANEE